MTCWDVWHRMRGRMTAERTCRACGSPLPDGAKECPRDGTPADLDASANEAWEATVRKDVLVGHQVGEYVVRRRIGSGGMGVVYEGEHPVIGRKVAIKIIRPDSSGGVRSRELVDEARAVSAIRHRGIIDIFGFGTLQGIGQYLVMEFLNGRPLDEVILDRAPMLPAEVIRLNIEVLSALSAAHAVGVIHRDLKPGNIFVVLESNGTEYVKVLDFGLAKQGTAPNRATPQTRASMIVGTPEYMAPEQACGQAVSPRTDLYAVGIIMFEMLTGRLPFQGDSAMQTAIMQVQAPPPAPSAFVNGVPPELDALVLRLMRKDPEQRPASAEVVARELKALAKTLAVEMTRLSGFARALPEPPSEPPSAGRPQARQGAPGAAAQRGGARPPVRAADLETLEAPLETEELGRSPPSRGMRLAMAVGMAALLMGAGVGLVMLRSNGGPSAPPVVVVPPPTPQEGPKEDPRATTASQQQLPVNPPDSRSGTEASDEDETQATPRTEPPDPGEASAPRISSAASAQQKKPKTGAGKPRRVKGNGTLKLVAECWAEVLVDGSSFGKAPRPPIVLTAGKHTLELRENPRVLEQRKEVFIPPGETVSHTIACGADGASG